MTIDMHVHAFPDSLAERAVAQLEEASGFQAVGNGKVAALIESMDQADIDLSVICAIATRADQVKNIYKWCRKIRSDRIEPFPSVHPRTPKAARWIERFAKEGFFGIKLHPMYQDFAADDPETDAIYAAAASCGLVVQIHCGRDFAFLDDDRASPERIARVLDRHPTLKLVATHLGGWRAWQEAERHLVGRDVHLETSFALTELGPEAARSLIERHGPQRVMFGTDWPWASQSEELERIRRLGLSDKHLRAVLYSNAARLMGY